MQPDLEFLRRHYAALSDDALLEIDRAELVDAARPLYDHELVERKLASKHALTRTRVEREEREPEEPADWLEDGVQAFSQVTELHESVASAAADARDVLEAAGIPCSLESEEMPPDETPRKAMRLWRVMVPGNRNMEATSVLQRDIFNQDFVATWQHHLEELSDDEVLEMDPQVTLCGLFDRIERVQRAYEDELTRRGLS